MTTPKLQQELLKHLQEQFREAEAELEDRVSHKTFYYYQGYRDAIGELIEWITSEGPNCGQTDD